MSFFTEQDEASRYARYRPHFHPLAITRAKEASGLKGTGPLAIDVACGTGQSSAALTSIAERVIGFDTSGNMLTNATGHDRIRYVQARAESMPFQSNAAPVMSCALAFHWFNRARFLSEAWRVLSPEGLLLLYNNGFTGIMREDPAFESWAQNSYPERYPVPPRDSRPFTEEEMKASGFVLIKEERYENEVIFTADKLVGYLTTQTNVVSAIRQGRQSLKTANRWLLAQVSPFFAADKATFVFATRAWYLRKRAAN